MASNAHDVQICLCKLIRFSAEKCAAFATKYPLVSSSILGAFLLYLFLPSVFWALVYSFPILVCIGVAGISLHGKRLQEKNGRRSRPAEDEYISGGEDHRKYGRVHSVRRTRPPREIAMQNYNVLEKTAVVSSNFNNSIVDKNALIEEKQSPKEIKEVQPYTCSCFSSSSSPLGPRKPDHFDQSSDPFDEDEITVLTGNEKNKASDISDNEEDNPKNLSEVVISDVETTKRLESLIARRRSRKLLNLEAQRKLINMQRNDQTSPQIGSILLTRTCNSEAEFFHSPGSAPSVLIPERNPFDIPYDPQEEKPDLTGDSFNQEFFQGNKELTYCRHESFSLGPYNANGEGFDHKKTEENPVEDQIKHVIQVDENNCLNCDDGSPSSSEEDDKPVFKIDKETILKSLSSMARRSGVKESEPESELASNEQVVSITKDHFFKPTTKQHLPSYSIASDLQVEVSEISSPPVTINDSISYQDDLDFSSTYESEMENRITWDGEEDLWTGSSHPLQVDDDESRSGVDEVSEADVIRVGFSRINGCDDTESYLGSKRSTNLDDKIFKTLEKSLSSMSLRQVTEEVKKVSSVSDNNDHPESSTQIDSDYEPSSIEARLSCDELQEPSSEPQNDYEGLSSIEAAQSSGEPQELTSISNVAVEESASVSPDSVLQLNVALGRGSMSSFDWEEDVHHQNLPQTAQVSGPTPLQNSTISSVDDKLNTSAYVEVEGEEENTLVSQEREQENNIKSAFDEERLGEDDRNLYGKDSDLLLSSQEEMVIQQGKIVGELEQNAVENVDQIHSLLDKDAKHEKYKLETGIIGELEQNTVEIVDQSQSFLDNDTKHEDYIKVLADQEREHKSIPSSLAEHGMKKQEFENHDPDELSIALSESDHKSEKYELFNAEDEQREVGSVSSSRINDVNSFESSQKKEEHNECSVEDQESKLDTIASSLVDDDETKNKSKNLATDELPIHTSSASDSKIEDDHHFQADESNSIT